MSSSARPSIWDAAPRNRPADVVHQARLQQQIPSWKEVVADEVLVGADSHSVADAEGAQDVQNLRRETIAS